MHLYKFKITLLICLALKVATPTLRTSPPPCGGQDQICSVQATPDGSGKQPQLTAALKDEMITALHFGTESTNVKLRNV